jgi:hypothetical protein
VKLERVVQSFTLVAQLDTAVDDAANTTLMFDVDEDLAAVAQLVIERSATPRRLVGLVLGCVGYSRRPAPRTINTRASSGRASIRTRTAVPYGERSRRDDSQRDDEGPLSRSLSRAFLPFPKEPDK